jgi:hypothetical protein
LTVQQLQLATSLIWLVTALVVAPGTLRLFFGRMRLGDASKSAFFFAALVFMGGSGRFLLAPESIGAWKLIYCLSILLAVYVWVIVWNLRRDA